MSILPDYGVAQQYDAGGHKLLRCEDCSRWFHQLAVHLGAKHGSTVAEYLDRHPGAPTITPFASERVSKAQARRRGGGRRGPSTPPPPPPPPSDPNVLDFEHVRIRIKKSEDLDPASVQHVPAVDPNFIPDVELLKSIAVSVESDSPIHLWGQSGIGKTLSVTQMYAMLGRPIRRITCRGDMRSKDFVGSKEVVIDEETNEAVTYFEYGVLPLCMKNGWGLLIDEIDAAPPHIAFALQEVLEKGVGPRRMVITDNNGELIEAHPDFRIFAGSNTSGRGDETGSFVGTNIQNAALMDRFLMVERVEYPNEHREMRIIRAQSDVGSEVAYKIRKFADKIREGYAGEMCSSTVSTRRAVSWAKLSRMMGLKKSYIVSIANRLDEDDRVFFNSVVQRELGFSI